MKNYKSPPKILEALLKLFLYDSTMYSALGDYAELYEHFNNEKGKVFALGWYIFQILKQLTAYCANQYIWSFVMLKNYLKTTFRYIRRHKMYSVLNISGLAIGMACFIMILFYVSFELSFDKFHKNGDRIYRVLVHNTFNSAGLNKWTVTPSAAAPALVENFPSVESAVRVLVRKNSILNYIEKIFKEKNIYLADPAFLNMFSFELLKGDPNTALDEPLSLLITQTQAFKYFGNENPLRKVIRMDNKYNFTVTGVLKNIPENSHHKFDFLGSFSSVRSIYGEKALNSWSLSNYVTYVQLVENTIPSELELPMGKFLDEKIDYTIPQIELQPLTDIYLSEALPGEKGRKGEKNSIYIFSLIGIFILIITCCNYMNLATARSVKRTMEVGVRKVIGASRKQLVYQFLGESMLFMLGGFLTAIILVYLFLPTFNSIIERNLSFEAFFTLPMFASLVGVVILVGLASGTYPAFFISSFKPAAAVKGSSRSSSKGSLFFRNSLVLVQFIISISLGVSTIVAYRQMDYISTKDPGFKKDQIVTLEISRRNNALREKEVVFKTALQSMPEVTAVSSSGFLPTDIRWESYAEWEGQGDKKSPLFHNLFSDYDFFELYDIELVAGRHFSKEIGTDAAEAFIVNETAVELMGFDDPIGKTFSTSGIDGKIIGVVKDFHFVPMNMKIIPLAIHINYDSGNWISVQLNSDDIKSTMISIEKKWAEFSPDFPFDYSFIDERFDALYKEDIRLGTIFGIFTFIAIFLACLGLFGLASFTVEQKTKEIGVRKVLGASSGRIVMLISSEFIKWVLLASFVAIPLAWYAMSNWISNYAYRINIGFDIFLSGIVLALLIVIISVSFQAAKAANSNPVESLRYE